MLSLELAEQLAFELTHGKTNVAFVPDGTLILFSRGSRPMSSLIQAVYDFCPQMARRILRSRIFSTAEPTDACRGMLKVAAKRATAPILPKNHRLNHEFRFQEIHPEPPPPWIAWEHVPKKARELFEKGQPMTAAFELASEVPREGKLYECDRKIAAILVDSEGRYLAAARSTNAKNRTRHAELNLVQAWASQGRMLPRGAKIFVTLKCCRMCAAAIWSESEDALSLRVYYGEDDPGPNARESILAKNGLLIAWSTAQELKQLQT